jgi:hypothetical protein
MPTLSDPRRLPRRNHYQEGPGFLFVATEGGRPPIEPLPDRRADAVRRRRRALRLWDEGRAIAEVCTTIGCSRASLFRWKERFAAAGLGDSSTATARWNRASCHPRSSGSSSPSAC